MFFVSSYDSYSLYQCFQEWRIQNLWPQACCIASNDTPNRAPNHTHGSYHESYPWFWSHVLRHQANHTPNHTSETYPESYLRIIPPMQRFPDTGILRNSHMCHTVHIIYFDSYKYIYICTIPFDLIFLEPAFSFPPVPSCFFSDRTPQPLYVLWRRTWTELAGQPLVSLNTALSNPYFWGGVL